MKFLPWRSTEATGNLKWAETPGEPGLSAKPEVDFCIKCAKIIVAVLVISSLTGCGMFSNRSGQSYVINGQRYHVLASAKGFKEKGLASWYGEPFHGRRTANGEVYDMNKISAAHKTLPLGTWVEVKNLQTRKIMVMRINDRGPFVKGRVIDLSREAAKKMDMLNCGVAPVMVKAIDEKKALKMIAAAEKKENRAAASAGQ